MNQLSVDEQAAGSRIDVYLTKQFPDTSRASWQRKITDGDVLYNQNQTKPKQQLRVGDVISINKTQPTEFASVELPVLHENEQFIVVDKPPGLLTHPIRERAEKQSVVGLMQSKLPSGSSESSGRRPGVVHRLDRDTSGVLLLAKTIDAQRRLAELFAERAVSKTYRAVLEGEFEHEDALIKLPLGRDMSAPATFKVDPNGKSAETKLERIAIDSGRSFVRLRPKTGRTHQLRVHCAHIDHPIVGDSLYGQSGQRLMLHAHRLAFSFDGQDYEFEAPLPAGFET